jgi:hypothetical protein
LQAVLRHELAHLKRRDHWTNLLQKMMRAVFFFHPAVWWVDKRLSLEREMACDDLVVAETADPRAYAACLLRLAEQSLFRRGLAMAQAAVHGLRQASARVVRILDGDRPGATGVSRPALSAVAGMVLVAVAVSSRVPRLLSFADAPAASTVATAEGDAVPVLAPTLARAVAPQGLKRRTLGASDGTSKVVARRHRAMTGLPVRQTEDNSSSSAANRISAAFQHGKGAASEVPSATAHDESFSPCSANADCDQTLFRNVEFTETIGNPAGPAVLVVTERQFFDANGRLIWSMSVYRLTVFRPAVQTQTIPAKQT